MDCANVCWGRNIPDAFSGCCLYWEQDCEPKCYANFTLDTRNDCCSPSSIASNGQCCFGAIDCTGTTACVIRTNKLTGTCNGTFVSDNHGGCCLPSALDYAGVCCPNTLDKNKVCCLSSEIDSSNVCCLSGTLDCLGLPCSIFLTFVGVCNGTAVRDKNNACCSNANIDANNVCCATAVDCNSKLFKLSN